MSNNTIIPTLIVYVIVFDFELLLDLSIAFMSEARLVNTYFSNDPHCTKGKDTIKFPTGSILTHFGSAALLEQLILRQENRLEKVFNQLPDTSKVRMDE